MMMMASSKFVNGEIAPFHAYITLENLHVQQK
jgi:hypothetical protein